MCFDKIVFSCFTGQYLLVIGEFLNAKDIPEIRASKIQDLTNEPNLQQLWPLEVQDLLNYLTSS